MDINVPHSIDERCQLANRLSTSDPSKIYLSMAEVLILGNFGKRFFEEKHQSGEGPRPIRMGHRTIRFRASDVLAWLESLSMND